MISNSIPFDSYGLDGTAFDAHGFDGKAFDPNRIPARTPGRWRMGP